MDNMKLYELGRKVPPEAQKTIKAGRLKGFTDINPMWRIKRLTELFGPCGVGWWYDITDKKLVPDEATKQVAAFLDLLLYYVEPETGAVSHGIPGTGGSSFVANEQKGPYMSDECFKMALTDALSVAAKALGIGADVYFDKDRNKYSAQPDENMPQNVPAKETFRCADCGAEIPDYFDQNGRRVAAKKWADESTDKYGKPLCLKCIAQRKAQGL